ncbi:nucleotidyltransferase family protein [Nitrospiraceae bacterium AH_259_D15_M11_P09]|nr:nucleotidyltransferase family protein [Nitrospiraceae bacterium AH_259_D15_M11_P09]
MIRLPVNQDSPLEALRLAASPGFPSALLRVYERVGDTAIWRAARENEMDALVAHALRDARGGEGLPSHWQQAHDDTQQRISSYLDELDRLAAQLASAGVPLVALKNGGIARGIHPCAGCCPMGDLDVLVEKRHFRTAHTIMLSNGYRFEFRSPLEKADIDQAEKGGGAEYWKLLPNGPKLWVEVQWRPVAGRWIRPDQEPRADHLLSRSVPIPGTAVRLLAPEDNLLQVALHTAKHSYVRAPGFRLHTDVDRIVRGQTVDWDHFLDRVLTLEVTTPVYFSLVIPRMLFSTPIPDEVLARLRPARWKEEAVGRWIERAGLFNPEGRKFGRIGYIGFTALLYDDLSGLVRAMFPDRHAMREQYGFRSDAVLPFYHVRRLADLLFRRVSP